MTPLERRAYRRIYKDMLQTANKLSKWPDVTGLYICMTFSGHAPLDWVAAPTGDMANALAHSLEKLEALKELEG